MTSFTRFHSSKMYDPFSVENVKQFNEDALNEIEKIKSKVGGNNYASTESLMKALVIPSGNEEDLKW